MTPRLWTPRLWMHVVNAALLVTWVAAIAVGSCGCATSAERTRALATDPPAAGMAVVDQSGVVSLPLGPVVEDVLAWWAFRFPAQAATMRDFAARGMIIVTAQDRPLYNIELRGPQQEMARDNAVQVWWDTRDGGAAFDARLRHGLGHVMLNAMGRGDVDHHAYMDELGYPWL